MGDTLKIRGKLLSGTKKAAFFTQLDWVKEQCLDKLGFVPYPGTLNLEVVKEDVPTLMLLKEEVPVRLIPPDPQFCEGRALRASIEGVHGCVFIPPHDVNIHKPNIVEFIAPVMVRSTLGVDDGDTVTVSVKLEARGIKS